MRFTVPLLLILCLATNTFADVMDGFRRGINLSHWYAQTMVGHYDESHLSTYFTEDDADNIADIGFDHVRLTFDDAPVFDGDADRFKQRVQMLLDAGLNVVVDLHPDGDYKQALAEPGPARAEFLRDWQTLADLLSDMPTDRVWFEVMNEPHGIPRDVWHELQLEAVDAIRNAAPDHVVVVSGGSWTNAATLSGDAEGQGAMKPYDRPDLVYTFHFYDPHLWTHQGASWGWVIAKRTKGLPWPADPAEADRIAADTTTDDEAAGYVRSQVRNGQMTRQYATTLLDRVKTWQDRHDVPVYVGEFGVYTPDAPRDSRLRWHAFVVDAFEDRGWGWAMWDYAGGFGIVSGDDREPDGEMVDALGLR
jgi:aryl-phospho-beta-D-glucosidase BglC (GH1 family)